MSKKIAFEAVPVEYYRDTATRRGYTEVSIKLLVEHDIDIDLGRRYRVTFKLIGPDPKEPKPEQRRYQMCDDQPAQIDCRHDDCRSHDNGKCLNISPAITLNADWRGTCWSYKPKEPASKLPSVPRGDEGRPRTLGWSVPVRTTNEL